MKKIIVFILMVALFASCAPVREGFVRRHTTGAAYNKGGGLFRERTAIPAPWK